MLLEKMSVNVGETTVIYIELHDIETSNDELRYGDYKFDEHDVMYLWYGAPVDGSDMSGWVKSPFNGDYSAAIINTLRDNNRKTKNCIYRIMNNDINFDETKYLAIDMESDYE